MDFIGQVELSKWNFLGVGHVVLYIFDVHFIKILEMLFKPYGDSRVQLRDALEGFFF